MNDSVTTPTKYLYCIKCGKLLCEINKGKVSKMMVSVCKDCYHGKSKDSSVEYLQKMFGMN